MSRALAPEVWFSSNCATVRRRQWNFCSRETTPVRRRPLNALQPDRDGIPPAQNSFVGISSAFAHAPDTKGFISPALNRIDLFPWNDVFDEGTYPTRFFASFRTTQAQNRRLKTSPGTGSPATDPRRRGGKPYRPPRARLPNRLFPLRL